MFVVTISNIIWSYWQYIFLIIEYICNNALLSINTVVDLGYINGHTTWKANA